MKPGRFIMNTDYCTPKISAQDTIELTIPSSFPAGPNAPVVFSVSKNIGNKEDSYRAYIKSNLFDYATGFPCSIVFDGAQGVNGITVHLLKAGSTFTLEVRAGTQASSDTYVGYGQTITAHIQTFVSPFQA